MSIEYKIDAPNDMKMVSYSCLLLLAVILLGGCKEGISAATQDPRSAVQNAVDSNGLISSKVPPMPVTETFTITGTVAYVEIEGGFFAIHADDGRRYDPINLSEHFRHDGLKVKINARLKKDAVSFHMYGLIIEIIDIEARETEK